MLDRLNLAALEIEEVKLPKPARPPVRRTDRARRSQPRSPQTPAALSRPPQLRPAPDVGQHVAPDAFVRVRFSQNRKSQEAPEGASHQRASGELPVSEGDD